MNEPPTPYCVVATTGSPNSSVGQECVFPFTTSLGANAGQTATDCNNGYFGGGPGLCVLGKDDVGEGGINPGGEFKDGVEWGYCPSDYLHGSTRHWCTPSSWAIGKPATIKSCVPNEVALENATVESATDAVLKGLGLGVDIQQVGEDEDVVAVAEAAIQAKLRVTKDPEKISRRSEAGLDAVAGY